jgi:hypothetical protein
MVGVVSQYLMLVWRGAFIDYDEVWLVWHDMVAWSMVCASYVVWFVWHCLMQGVYGDGLSMDGVVGGLCYTALAICV